MSERLEQGAYSRSLGAVEPPIDLARHQNLRGLRERACQRQPRPVDRTEARGGLHLAATKTDALQRTQGRETLRFAREPEKPMKRPVDGFAGHEHVPEERAVLDGASVHVDFRDHRADPANRVARHRDMPDPHAPLLGQDAGAHGVEQRVSLLQHSRHDQGYFASPKARADAVESPAAALPRRAHSEELDHGRQWSTRIITK